jgi:hypothetical protein
MVILGKKNNHKKFKCGTGCLLAAFVALAILVVVCNMMITGQHTAQITEQSRKAEEQQRPAAAFPKQLSAAKPDPSLKRRQPGKSPVAKNPEALKEANTLETTQIEAKNPATPKQETTTQQRKQDDSRASENIHIVFSTSCNNYKLDWQSYLLFFLAFSHNQPGDVTRIVSGCSPEQQKELSKLHQERIAIMNERFHIHFTPEYGVVPGVSWQATKYWNKPFGVKHWLENKFGYRYEGKISTPFDDVIVVLVDPDMLFQRPFINDFSEFPIDHLWSRHVQKNPESIHYKVTHGHPIAQDYSFGNSWLNAGAKNLSHVVGPDSPVHKVTMEEAQTLYPAGPPYVMTARDMYRVAYHWADFLPRLFDINPKFMSEMYAYCMAAAHLGLPHQLARGFMVSNVGMDQGEGWSFMKYVREEACQVDKLADKVPYVIHFCQRYSIGEYFLSKYKLPTDILTCDFPLLEPPPLDIAASTNYSHYGDDSVTVWGERNQAHRYRNAFLVCSIMSSINKAATFYKDHHCPNGANYNKTWNHFRQR